MTAINLLRRAQIGAAWSLSGVTAVTVALAVTALIADPALALLFAGAFVVLDLVKYSLWPTAREALTEGRTVAGLAMIAVALALAAVSAWATAERLTTAITARTVQHQAHQQRIADLEAGRTADALVLDQLAAEAAATRTQADALRARGMATPALNLETAALARIDAHRAEARERMEHAARELATLRAQAVPAALPAELAPLLGLGLALALEIVPALLLTALRTQPETPSAPQKPAETVPETAETADPGAELHGDDAQLLQALLSSTTETDPGTPIKLREFARTNRIGNLRAANLFRIAAEAGAIRKTATGYVAA